MGVATYPRSDGGLPAHARENRRAEMTAMTMTLKAEAKENHYTPRTTPLTASLPTLPTPLCTPALPHTA